MKISLYFIILFVNINLFAQVRLNVSIVNVTQNYFNGSNIIYNGSFTIAASGGTGPYVYQITNLPVIFSVNNISGNGYFANVPAFTYKVSVFDVNKVKIADTLVTVSTIYPQPNLFCFLKIPSSCDSINGRIVFQGKGGTPPYTYSIDGGVSFTNNDTFPNLATGYYNCLLKDANGMLALFTTSRCYRGCLNLPPGVNPPYFGTESLCPFLATAYIGNESNCNKNGIINIFTNSFLPPLVCYPPYYYSMDGINYLPSNTTPFSNVIEENLPPGLYKIYFKDSIGQTQIFSISLAKFCAIQITYISVDASCQQSDGRITIKATDGIKPYTYTMDGINFQSNSTFLNLAAGSYNFSVKDANGVISTSGATIYNKCPVIAAIKTDDSCSKSKGAIQCSGTKGTKPYLFSKDGINFQTDSLFKSLLAGDYTLTLQDANFFKDSILVTIINNCLNAAVSSTNETCGNKNGTITVTGSGGKLPYIFSIDNINFQNSNVFNGLDSGTYIITIKDADGSTSTTKVNIVNIAAPAISATATTASCNGSDAVITVTNIGGIAPFLYSIDGLSYQNSNVFTNVNQGNYNVQIKDANSCTGTDTIQVIKYPTPVFFIGDDTALCTGETILLKAPIGNQYQYIWQDNSVADTYTVTNTGLFFLKVTNQYNCFFTDTILIRFKSTPYFSLGNDTSLCSGKTLNLQKFKPGWSYLWNTGSVLSSISINSPGLFWLKVSDSGCTKTDSLYVSLIHLPVADLGTDTSICVGQTLQLKINDNNASYLWQDNSTNNIYTVTHEGSYSVLVTKNNCTVGDTIYVQYQLKPNFTLGADQSICEDQTILLQPVVNPDWQLNWNNGSNQLSYKVTQPGLIYLDAKNACGITRKEVLFTKGLCSVYIPNAFSPNGDGKNDLFKVSGTELITEFHLQLFNRYGQLIFETTDKHKGWDGNIKNHPVQSGNYVYLLEYKESTLEKKQIVRGSCLLIR